MVDKDSDKEVQRIRLTGALWNIKLILGIIKDLLIIAVMIAILCAVIILIPKVSAGLQSIGELQNSMNEKLNSDNNPDYNGNNPTDYNQQGQTTDYNKQNQMTDTKQDQPIDYNKQTNDNSQTNYNPSNNYNATFSEKLGNLPQTLYEAVQRNDWQEATNMLNIMKSKLPPDSQEYQSMTEKFQLLDQAITNKDKALVEKVFNS